MLKNHLKIALRLFRRHKGHSFINVAGLAVGMATCLLILLFVRDEMSYDTHHEKADQIYRLVTSGTRNGSVFNTARSPAPAGSAMQEAFPEVVTSVRVRVPDSRFAVEYGSQIFFERGFFMVDSTFFDVFSHTFLRGDPETALDAPSVVVITEAAALKYFADEDPMGKTIRSDFTHDLTVTGVIETPTRRSHMHFDFLVSMRTADYWLDTTGNLMIQPGFANWNQQSIYTYVELAEGVHPETVVQKTPALVRQHSGPPQPGSETNFALQVLTHIHLRSHLPWEIEANGNASHIYIFLAVAAVVLLIACINFMNLATARSIRRAKEVGVRKVNGARRGQLIGPLLGESLLVTCVASVLATALLLLLLPAFNALTDKDLAYAALGSPIMLGSLLSLTLLVGLLAGSYPAFVLSAFKPVDMMRGTFQGGRAAIRKVLVIVQFTISIILLASLGVIYTQMTFIQKKDLGYDRAQVVAIPLSDPQTRGRTEPYRQAVNLGYPFEYRFMDDLYDQMYQAETKFSQVFGYFILVALLIACLGLFGLVAFTAAQRTKEIGVRNVLGASVGSIIALIARDFIKLVGIAFVLAAPVAYLAMHRWLDTFAYRIDLAWTPFLLAGGVALLTALLTVSYQAIKASLADPVQSLRYE